MREVNSPLPFLGVVPLLISLYWVFQLIATKRKPADWIVPRSERFPIRMTRDRYVASSVASILVGVGVFAFMAVVFPT